MLLKTLGDQSRFFKPKWYINNWYYIRSREWSNWYVYMHDNSKVYLKGTSVKPGYEGQWKVIKFKDNRFMPSPRKWPIDSFTWTLVHMVGSKDGMVIREHRDIGLSATYRETSRPPPPPPAVNPFMPKGTSLCHWLDQSFSVLRVVGWLFHFYSNFNRTLC